MNASHSVLPGFRKFLPGAFLLGFLPLCAPAQERGSVSLTRPDPGGGPLLGAQPASVIALRWDERAKGNVVVTVPNPDDAPLEISGVQCSANLFLVSFDALVPPHGEGHVVVMVDTQLAAESGLELVRVRTSRGVQTLEIRQQRDKAVEFERKDLAWELGETATKSVTVTVVPNTATVKLAWTTGSDKVTLVPLGSDQFRIEVTPARTDKPQRFPVIIEFEPALPGVANVIACTVGAKP